MLIFFRNFVLLVMVFSGQLLAQQKFEKESRINPSDVPENAINFIEALPFESKIKWYKEEGFDRVSIEAKFTNQRTKYSIEFDTLGKVEDVEIEVSIEDIKSDSRKVIAAQLESDCERYSISKVQKQYSGNTKDLIAFLSSESGHSPITMRYEVVVVCRQERKVTPFEYLFSEEGELLSISEIIFKNSSHLEY
jgi:hypothetical protein